MDGAPKAASWWRWLLLVSIVVVSAGYSSGQETQRLVEPNLEILRLHWEKQVRLPRNYDPSVIPTGSAFNDPSRASSGTRGIDATRGGNSSQNTGSTLFPSTPSRLQIVYVYSMRVKNLSSKEIAGIAWDYVFLDAGTNTELGKHQFLSYERIPTARVATMQAQLRSAPTKVVRATNSEKDKHPKLIERSVIQCVLYADDTVWKSPGARDGVCEMLKNNKALLKRKSS